MSWPRGVIVLGLIAIVSIALNLFLAGVQLGHQVRGPAPPPNFEQRLDSLWRNMPAADQLIARDVMKQHRAEIIEKWRALRAVNQRATLALRSDPVDREEVQAAFDKSNQRVLEFRKAFQDAIAEVASKISPASREQFRAPGNAL